MGMHFRLADNYDDPCHPSESSYVSGPVAGRWNTLDEALRAAALRALQLADDPCSEAHSIDVAVYLDGASGGMTLASIHVWFDHGSGLPWLPALRVHLGAGQHTDDHLPGQLATADLPVETLTSRSTEIVAARDHA